MQLEQDRRSAGAWPASTPVTLLTGFLGSGKTTLLNTLLADSRMKSSAVIINEFGSISVDHDLVRTSDNQYVATSTGCMCCTASSDIRTSLRTLYDDRQRGAIPPFDRVIIETTGLADPAPVVDSLIRDDSLATSEVDQAAAQAFRLAGVLCVFDAEHGVLSMERHFGCYKQLAFADHIIVTKTDIVPENIADESLAIRLGRINPAAAIHDSHQPGFDPVALIGANAYSIVEKPEDVLGWLAMEKFQASVSHDHLHDPNRHGAAIQALPLFCDEALDSRAVDSFLHIVTHQPHAGLLRLKGIFALADDPGRPLVAHAIQHRLYPTKRLDRWPSADIRSRVVIIGNNMPLDPIRQLFDALRPFKRLRRARA